jgi:hypothetical protein
LSYPPISVLSCSVVKRPFTLHPSPFTLHPSPFTLHPSPFTLHPSPFTLQTSPFTLHAGEKPTPEKIEEMEKEYRKNIKKSPMWDMILKEYGEARAEELLLECKVKID